MKKLAVLCLFLMLGGCTVYKLAPSGQISVGNAYSINLNNSWSLYEFGHLRTYTRDGPALGVVRVSTGIKENEHLLAGHGEETQPPYKKNLTLIELQQFITDSFIAIGAEKLSFTDIRPEPFGTWQGIRAEFDFYSKSGLKRRGLIVGAQQNDKFYYILYEAPAMHFFDKNKSEVEEIIRSVKVKPEA